MDLKTIMRDAGIVGAGGAGFPSYMKLAPGADTLLINGAECEPLLYTDYILMRDEMARIARGAAYVMKAGGMTRTLVCVKQHNVEALGLHDGEELSKGVFIKQLPNVYPMGDEINMIYEATGRVVRPGALPITVGVIVYNAETVYNICRAFEDGTPVTDKWCMIGGAVEKPIVFTVPVGTRIRDLFDFYGVTVPMHHVVIDGGPSMGNVIPWQTAFIKKNTKSLLILPEDIPAVVSKLTTIKTAVTHGASNCCQCTRCTDMCPRALLGYPLEPHRMIRSATSVAEVSPELVRTATLCCNCGICELAACCQGISPRAVINEYKKILAKNKIRYTADTDVTPSPDREYRMLPSSRWSAMLGVSKFDRVAVPADKTYQPKRVTVCLSQHIGAPSVPAVAVGDTVTKGQMIASAAEGLSVPQYASIDGRVVSVADGKIEIERV